MSPSRNAQAVPPRLLDIEDGTRPSETSGSEVRWAPRNMPDPATPPLRPMPALTLPGAETSRPDPSPRHPIQAIQEPADEPDDGMPAPRDAAPPTFCSEGAEVTKVFQPNLGDLGIRRSDMAPPDPGALLDVDPHPDVDGLPDELSQLILSAPREEDTFLSFDDETSAYSHEQLGLLSKESAGVATAEEEVTRIYPAPSEIRCSAPRRRPASFHSAGGSGARGGAHWMQLGFPAWAVGSAVVVALGVMLLGVLALGPRGLRSELRSRAAILFPGLADTHNARRSGPDAPAPAPPSSASKPALVRLMISANPPETRLFLDDQPVANPFDVMRAPEGRVHMLRAEAPGRSAMTRVVTLDRDLTIFLELGYGTADAAASGR